MFVLFGCDQPEPTFDVKELDEDKRVLTEEGESDLVDPDYCFRLRSPGRQWKLLSEKEISGILPDAVAGAAHANGVFGAIIVEACGNAKLRDYADLLLAYWEDAGLRADTPRPVQYKGRPALHCQARGTIDGLSFLYEILIFVHQKHGYQVQAWGLAAKFKSKYAEDFRQAFSLTDGTVRARGRTAPVKDFSGVGQRVKAGRFESAISGLAANSNEHWTVMVGAELSQANEDAEIGMKNVQDNLYFVVTPESIGGLDKSAYLKQIITTNEQALSEGGRLTKLPGTERILEALDGGRGQGAECRLPDFRP